MSTTPRLSMPKNLHIQVTTSNSDATSNNIAMNHHLHNINDSPQAMSASPNAPLNRAPASPFERKGPVSLLMARRGGTPITPATPNGDGKEEFCSPKNSLKKDSMHFH